jgi:hypothetical protein
MIIINALKTHFKAPTSVYNLFVGNIPHNHIKHNTERFYTYQKANENQSVL